MKIAINPGHKPGQDSGCIGSKITEAEYVEKVAKIVCDDLEAYGHETLLIQENELYDICSASDDYGADVFVSIHCNAYDHTAQGTETYYYSVDGYYLAMNIQSQLLDTMGSVDRGIKQAGFYVIKRTEAIAALCEIDFLDNPEREDYLLSHISDIANAISRGITDYIESLGD